MLTRGRLVHQKKFIGTMYFDMLSRAGLPSDFANRISHDRSDRCSTPLASLADPIAFTSRDGRLIQLL
jgi:hypothetical protein